jgi:hypothetical protein
MKLSENTISILKNFSGINQSLLFQKGNTLRTISPQKTVMAEAKIEDTIPGKAAVYDLARFLSTLSLFDAPDVDFGETMFTIQDGRRSVNYTYASESMIVTPPDKEIRLPSVDVDFNITSDDLQNVIRAAGILQVGDVEFSAKEGLIVMSAIDVNNPTSDRYDIEVTDYDGDDFSMSIKVDNLKLIPEDYKISLSSAGMSHFKSNKVEYWIAVQSN